MSGKRPHHGFYKLGKVTTTVPVSHIQVEMCKKKVTNLLHKTQLHLILYVSCFIFTFAPIFHMLSQKKSCLTLKLREYILNMQSLVIQNESCQK